MFDSVRQFVETTDPLLQWLAIIAISAIPFVESYLGAALGVLVGIPTVVAIVAAIIGNWLSMLFLVLFGHKLHGWRATKDVPLSPRKQKFKDMFDKYGVAGISLLGQTLLPSQLTAMAMVTLGVNKQTVIFWQTISIILWGVAFGVMTEIGYNVISQG